MGVPSHPCSARSDSMKRISAVNSFGNSTRVMGNMISFASHVLRKYPKIPNISSNIAQDAGRKD